MTNARPSFPEVTRPSSFVESNSSMMSHHLDLVRSGVASIEEELQQRASLLAVDNANLRTILEQTNGELHTLRGRLSEFDVSQKKLVKMQQQILASDKENKTLKQTLKYLQSELVKSGKKMPNLASVGGAMGGGGMPPPKPPPPSLPP
jgi:predicted RNase H-like nuclease (RuvC/YqgF family)